MRWGQHKKSGCNNVEPVNMENTIILKHLTYRYNNSNTVGTTRGIDVGSSREEHIILCGYLVELDLYLFQLNHSE